MFRLESNNYELILDNEVVKIKDGNDTIAIFQIEEVFQGLLSELCAHSYKIPTLQKAKLQAGIALHAGGMYGEVYHMVREFVETKEK